MTPLIVYVAINWGLYFLVSWGIRDMVILNKNRKNLVNYIFMGLFAILAIYSLIKIVSDDSDEN
jgi:uncharacterized membrane protein YuzA (DUF378 family)